MSTTAPDPHLATPAADPVVEAPHEPVAASLLPTAAVASQHGPPATVVVLPLKTPGIAVLLSFLWLGAGHLYAGRTTTGVALLVADVFIVLIALIPFVGWIAAPLLWLPSVAVTAITAANAVKAHNAQVLHAAQR